MALFNQAHTTSASLLAGCCFNGHLLHLLFDTAPKAVIHHFLIDQASNLELAVKDISVRLGVRCILALALLRINLKTTSAKFLAQASHMPHSINPFGVEGQPLLLTREELTALTGTNQAARQRSWLDARGWPYEEAFGRSSHPRVARMVFVQKMLSKDPYSIAGQPRFDALDKFARLT
jgi:hypothetical protein